MEFKVVGVDVDRRTVRVRYGDVSITCKIVIPADIDTPLFVIKPKNVFIRREVFEEFLSTVRQSWQAFSNGAIK